MQFDGHMSDVQTGMLGTWRRKLKKELLSVYVILVAPQFYLLFPFFYAKIADILATQDKLFWPRLYREERMI